MTKVALVTGGATRVGRAIVERLAADGYAIGLHYHRSEQAAVQTAAELKARYGTPTHLQAADLAQIDQVHALTASVVEALGGLDVLVNSASIFYPTPDIAAMEAAWDDFQRVNLQAPFLLSVTCAKALRQRRGAIINIADINAYRPLRRYLPYSVSKAGLVALTRGLALELAPDVRVNAIAPGVVLLGVAEPPGREATLAQEIPLGRVGDPTDIAGAVAFLATAPYVTGQVLTVDGGRSLSW